MRKRNRCKQKLLNAGAILGAMGILYTQISPLISYPTRQVQRTPLMHVQYQNQEKVPKELEQYISQNPYEENRLMLDMIHPEDVNAFNLERLIVSIPETHDTSSVAEKRDNIHVITDQYTLKAMYAYMQYFENDANRRMVGTDIDNDVKNDITEYGGIVVANPNGLQFIRIPSVHEKKKDKKFNVCYQPPSWIDQLRIIGVFHFHASSKDLKTHAGPSGQDARRIAMGQIDCVVSSLSDVSMNADVFSKSDEGVMSYDIAQCSKY